MNGFDFVDGFDGEIRNGANHNRFNGGGVFNFFGGRGKPKQDEVVNEDKYVEVFVLVMPFAKKNVLGTHNKGPYRRQRNRRR